MSSPISSITTPQVILHLAPHTKQYQHSRPAIQLFLSHGRRVQLSDEVGAQRVCTNLRMADAVDSHGDAAGIAVLLVCVVCGSAQLDWLGNVWAENVNQISDLGSKILARKMHGPKKKPASFRMFGPKIVGPEKKEAIVRFRSPNFWRKFIGPKKLAFV